MTAARTQPGTGVVLTRPSRQHGSVFQIRWRVNGGPARYSTIGPNRRDAEQALASKLAEINRGTNREPKVGGFHTFASDWFGRHRAHLRPSAVERMRNDLQLHLLPFFGEYLIEQIGAELIERYMSEKVSERGEGSGLSNVSINKTLTLLRQVLAAAVRYGYLEQNPVDHVRRLRVIKKDQAFLQLDQIEALVGATPERYRPLLWTLLLAGLRIGEALALRWSDVHLHVDPARLTVRRTWDPASRAVGADHRGIEGPVKSGGEGTVTVGARLCETLLDHRSQSLFDSEQDLVFPTSTGRPQNPSNFRNRVLAVAVERANERLRIEGLPLMPPITPHSLRHTYCSLLVSSGEALSTVAAQMRHADPSTTLKVYTHVMKHRREGVAARLDDVVFGGRPT